MTFNAQEYFDKNLTDKSIKVISSDFGPFNKELLTGELVIQDYPNLEEIYLPNHELTSLKLINCPNLKSINVRANQLTKLEIEGDNQISEIIAGGNELSELNLTNCSKLAELIIPDNPYLTEIKGLNLSSIKNINITNTAVNLAQDYEILKASKEEALKAVKILKEAAEEKGFTLTEAVQNSIQAEEAIQRLLKKTEKDYRWWLDNPNQALPSFQLPETRRRIQEFLLAIIQTKVSGNYQAFLEQWNYEDNAHEVFASTLVQLAELLRAKNYLKDKEVSAKQISNFR